MMTLFLTIRHQSVNCRCYCVAHDLSSHLSFMAQWVTGVRWMSVSWPSKRSDLTAHRISETGYGCTLRGLEGHIFLQFDFVTERMTVFWSNKSVSWPWLCWYPCHRHWNITCSQTFWHAPRTSFKNCLSTSTNKVVRGWLLPLLMQTTDHEMSGMICNAARLSLTSKIP